MKEKEIEGVNLNFWMGWCWIWGEEKRQQWKKSHRHQTKGTSRPCATPSCKRCRDLLNATSKGSVSWSDNPTGVVQILALITHSLTSFFLFQIIFVAHDIVTALKIMKSFWHPILWWRIFLFKESPPSIMVTRNPNWSTEIV